MVYQSQFVLAQDARDRFVVLDDVPGEDPAVVKIKTVTDIGHGMLRLTCAHPTLGTWRPEYQKRHRLRLAPGR